MQRLTDLIIIYRSVKLYGIDPLLSSYLDKFSMSVNYGIWPQSQIYNLQTREVSRNRPLVE